MEQHFRELIHSWKSGVISIESMFKEIENSDLKQRA
jgi:hypothetical protein